LSLVSLNDKIELIYEFNEKSPLFSRVAFIHLENKRFEQALEVCEDGLKNYPNYPTAIFVYALALANLGRREEALTQLQKALESIDDDETFAYYRDEIEQISSELANVPEPFKKGFQVEELNLVELAKKIEGFKLPKLDNTKEYKTEIPPNEYDSKIVSETMADIYYKQGNLIEALAMYEELAKKKPEKAIGFQVRINKINEKLSS